MDVGRFRAMPGPNRRKPLSAHRMRLPGSPSLATLAARCGLSPSTLCRIEGGILTPSTDALPLLARAYRLGQADLLRLARLGRGK